jgi:membrane fusion protein
MTAVTLFRPAALEHHRRADQAGVPLPAAPPPAVLAWGLVAAVVLAIGLGAMGSYARKQRVAGYVAPISGVARIVTPRAGVIVAVHVHDGETVAAGAPLVTIQSGAVDAGGAQVDAAVLDALDRQRAGLAEQVALEAGHTVRERARLTDHIATLTQEHDALQAQLQLQTQRTEIARQQVEAARDLVAHGNLTRTEFQRRQDTVLAQLQAAATLTRDLAAKQSEVDQDRNALDALADVAAARIAALRGQMAELDTRRAETQGRAATLLRAPIAGRVTAVQAAVGQTASLAIPLLAVIPLGEALRAELLVPAWAIGEVRPGQLVRLAFDAFPSARFGLASGHVRSVSRSLLRPSELDGPVTAQEPCYRVSVTLDRQAIGTGAAALPLVPDLTLKAAIVIDRRTLLGWLLAPLRDRMGGGV